MRAALLSIFIAVLSFLHLVPQPTTTPTAPPQVAAVANAVATAFPPESATTSGSASNGSITSEQQPTSNSPEEANSYQTTQSPFVKSPDFSPKSAVSSNPALSPPTPASAFVTQDQFNAGLSALGDSLRQVIYQNVSVPNSPIGTGGIVNEIAGTNKIDQLDNVTITNPTITGLSAVAIPDLSGSYLSLGGGTLTGAFVDSGTASSSFVGALGVGTSSPSDVFAVNGPIFLGNVTPAATTNRLYSNAGSLYWAGSLVGGGSVGNWTSDGTNVWRVGGNVGIGTSSPFATLSVNGTGYFAAGITALNATTTLCR
jgi:hypothetical protein